MDMQHYADNFIPVIPVEHLCHTDKRPFCYEPACPCHTDDEAIGQVKAQYKDGLLTAEEVELIIKGKTF